MRVWLKTFILTMPLAASCGGDSAGPAARIGRCYVSSTVVPAVQSCIEFSPLDDTALAEARAACDEPETGVVKSWTEGASCTKAGRIGECVVMQAATRSVTFVYSTGAKDTDDFAREHSKESCLAGANGEPAGTWTDLFES